ncbi:hypothetical protein GBF38_016272 [Nibea albiflora]|uniref:Uncharacterized protein n=1 Tax=Nibea albiflora TaxID=240163 RepID=A0ACB7FIB4_NIBAL|nr:hypothetical protein GBF38_016272 [Nibea albiflora]
MKKTGPYIGDAPYMVDMPLVGERLHIGATHPIGHPIGFRRIFGDGLRLANPDNEVVQPVVNTQPKVDEHSNEGFHWLDEFAHTTLKMTLIPIVTMKKNSQHHHPPLCHCLIHLSGDKERRTLKTTIRSKRMRFDESCDEESSGDEFWWWDEFANTDSETESDTAILLPTASNI